MCHDLGWRFWFSRLLVKPAGNKQTNSVIENWYCIAVLKKNGQRVSAVFSRSHISYSDFLETFEVRETEEGHKWLKSTHRYSLTQVRLFFEGNKHMWGFQICICFSGGTMYETPIFSQQSKFMRNWNKKPINSTETLLWSVNEVPCQLKKSCYKPRAWWQLELKKLQAFRGMDSNGKGILTKTDLQETLRRFLLPVSKEEFKKLWKRSVMYSF